MSSDWRPRLTAIEDCIAEDVWAFKDGDRDRAVRVRVGRPFPLPDDPNGDWCCPVLVDELTNGVRCVYGVGPIDALINAAIFTKGLFSRFSDVVPRGNE